VPDVSQTAPAVYRTLHQAMQNGWVLSCHDLSEGGLAVAAAEMCIGGRLGMEISASLSPEACFSETNGCLLAEVSPENSEAFEKNFMNLPFVKIGKVLELPELKISGVEIPVSRLVEAFNNPAESKVS
jgi:phosphoribosylformylglycinamidine synthase